MGSSSSSSSSRSSRSSSSSESESGGDPGIQLYLQCEGVLDMGEALVEMLAPVLAVWMSTEKGLGLHAVIMFETSTCVLAAIVVTSSWLRGVGGGVGGGVGVEGEGERGGNSGSGGNVSGFNGGALLEEEGGEKKATETSAGSPSTSSTLSSPPASSAASSSYWGLLGGKGIMWARLSATDISLGGVVGFDAALYLIDTSMTMLVTPFVLSFAGAHELQLALFFSAFGMVLSGLAIASFGAPPFLVRSRHAMFIVPVVQGGIVAVYLGVVLLRGGAPSIWATIGWGFAMYVVCVCVERSESAAGGLLFRAIQ